MEMEINRKIYSSVVQENGNKIRFLKAFGEGTRFGVMYITFEDEVYGVGYNGDFNLLGVSGDNFLRKRLENPTKISRLCGKGIQHVCLGDHLAVGLGVHGELYQWGLPYSQMRSCYDRNSIQLPHLMTGCTHLVTKLDCGGGFFAVTTSHKKVFMWGYIDWSAPFSDGRLFSPMHKEVVDIACGTWHIVMLTADGKPYSCGHGGYGQLGYDWSESNGYWRIEKILFNEPCVKVAAASVSSFVITASGELYAFGLNHIQFGFLGVDSEEPTIKRPIRVRLDVPVRDVATSYALATLRNVYAAVSRDGSKIYKWGWGCDYRWPHIVNDVTNLRDVFHFLPTPPLHCFPHTESPSQNPTDSSPARTETHSHLLCSQCSIESTPQPEEETYEDRTEDKQRIVNDTDSKPRNTEKENLCEFQNISRLKPRLSLNNHKPYGEFNKNYLHAKRNKLLNTPSRTTDPTHHHHHHQTNPKSEVLCEDTAYKSYLDYVYSGGSKHLTFTELLDVHILATHYEESQLIEHTTDQIKSRLSVANFSVVLERSQINKSSNLKELCDNFIKELCKDPEQVVKLITTFQNSKTS